MEYSKTITIRKWCASLLMAMVSTQATAFTESICGTDDKQFVNETPQAPFAYPLFLVLMNKNPVGALQTGSSPLNGKWCSGTLISEDLFLTAGHCIDETNATNVHVSFNYERQSGPFSDLLTQDIYPVVEVVESQWSNDMDYAIVRLGGQPGLQWGYSRLSDYVPADNSFITIIQHPNGEAKQVDGGVISKTDDERAHYSSVDTLPGSSGSGVFDMAGRIVAVHTNGGCSGDGRGANKGYMISAIKEVSPTLQEMFR